MEDADKLDGLCPVSIEDEVGADRQAAIALAHVTGVAALLDEVTRRHPVFSERGLTWLVERSVADSDGRAALRRAVLNHPRLLRLHHPASDDLAGLYSTLEAR